MSSHSILDTSKMLITDLLKGLIRPLLSVALGLMIGLSLTWLAGENPLNILSIIWVSAFGSAYDFGMTLAYTTPLVFTGLGVAMAFRAGLFNIGAEGQLAMGAFAAATIGIVLPNVPHLFAPLLASCAAFVAGAAWGGIAGWLRAKRGSHEVITTIMLNFVAAGLLSYGTLYLFPNPDSQNPETALISAAYRLKHFDAFGGAPVGPALLVALVMTFLFWFFFKKTVIGFELKAVGMSEKASNVAGIHTARIRILAMALSGGLAGLVGIGEVLGSAGRFKLDFSPGYGFMGIAVALLGRGKPLGVLAASFLFGILYKGTSELDFETDHITKDLSLILQALVILCVSADGLWKKKTWAPILKLRTSLTGKGRSHAVE